MYRSIVIEERNNLLDFTAAAAFVDALHADLKLFGRDDVSLITVGGLKVLVWNPIITSAGSNQLRAASMAHRLAGQKAVLQGLEAALPAAHFSPFSANLLDIDPEIVICQPGTVEAQLFDYVVWAQSIAADIQNFRSVKVLVYDRAVTPRRLFGAILLKSPMYFDGARDAHLGWPPLFHEADGERVKDQAAVDLRNQALKSIYNISVCMLASPYDVHGMGKLMASLCFSPEIIDHIEARFGQPVLGMTTTGGWGGSATQYEKLVLAGRAGGGKRPLFQRAHGKHPSLNYPVHLFSAGVLEAAMEVLKAAPTVAARDYLDYAANPKTARRLFRRACSLIGLPNRATASNCVAHYFASVSDACKASLASIPALSQPPAVRSIPIADAVTEWRTRQKIAAPLLTAVSATILSTVAT